MMTVTAPVSARYKITPQTLEGAPELRRAFDRHHVAIPVTACDPLTGAFEVALEPADWASEQSMGITAGALGATVSPA